MHSLAGLYHEENYHRHHRQVEIKKKGMFSALYGESINLNFSAIGSEPFCYNHYY